MIGDAVRATAICLVLALPDPPDLRAPSGRPRGYKYTQGRDPKRNPDELKRELGTAYVERRRHESGRDLSEIVSLRRCAKVLPMRRRA